MSVKRFDDWEDRLQEYIASVREAAFYWGQMDCALFVASCIEAMTGVDPARSFRGRYGTAVGAAMLLQRFAGGGLIEAVEKFSALMGLEEVSVETAQRGDVVLVGSPQGTCLGIVDLSGRFIFVADLQGLARLPLRNGVRAWHV